MKKDIGVGVKPPEKECKDINCPWHGKISVRGRVFQGSVRSAKSHNTVIVEWGYHRFVPKYERYERRKSRAVAHNPPCIHAREGEMVVIAECRPISKTKHFVVAGKLGRAKLDVKGEEQMIAKKEIVSRPVQSKTRDLRLSLHRTQRRLFVHCKGRDEDISSSKAKEEMKKPPKEIKEKEKSGVEKAPRKEEKPVKEKAEKQEAPANENKTPKKKKEANK